MFSSNDNTNYYNNLYKIYGKSSKSIGWNRNNQDLRFNSLIYQLKFIDNFGDVVDIGSGFSDFYFFLLRSKITFDKYIGFEVIKPFCELSIKQFENNINVKIYNDDFLNFKDKVDTTFASGIFGIGSGIDSEMYEYVEKIIDKSVNISRKAIALNFLSPFSSRKSFSNSFHPQINQIVEILSKYSYRFIVDHSYSPFEFTITIFKNESINDFLWYDKY